MASGKWHGSINELPSLVVEAFGYGTRKVGKVVQGPPRQQLHVVLDISS
jgi:hypothetical protein